MKKYKRYLKNQKLRRNDPSIRQIRNGEVKSNWVYEPFVPPVFYDYPIAIRQKEMAESGCPRCGYRSGSSHIQAGGAAVWSCGSCGKGCEMWHEDLTVSPFNNGQAKLITHPRLGTPSHGRPDKVPKEGGEYFRSRGVGMDSTPGCFVCGGEKGMYNNISGYVHCKEAGERIVKKFETGAYLDYREFEPDYIQVKIGACKKHVHCLEELSKQTREAGGRITNRMITTAKKAFFISEEAKSDLRQFKRDNKLTSSLLLEYAIYNERYGKDLPEEWLELREQVEKLHDLADKFDEKCWPDIHEMTKDLDYNSKYIYEDDMVKMLAMSTAGRFMMSIVPNVDNFDEYVTFLGVDGQELGKCGLQACYGLFNNLKNYVDDIIDNWDKEKFIEHKEHMEIV